MNNTSEIDQQNPSDASPAPTMDANASLYFTLLYDLPTSDQPSSGIVLNTIRNYINEFENVPLTANYFVIKCNTPKDRNKLYNELSGLLADYHLQLNFFLSPLYSGGKFVGTGKGTPWDELNEITQTK